MSLSFRDDNGTSEEVPRTFQSSTFKRRKKLELSDVTNSQLLIIEQEVETN